LSRTDNPHIVENELIRQSRIMMRAGRREVAYGRGGISIQRHLAELQIKILSKQTFKLGVAILTSLIRDRYSSASRSEQRQVRLWLGY